MDGQELPLVSIKSRNDQSSVFTVNGNIIDFSGIRYEFDDVLTGDVAHLASNYNNLMFMGSPGSGKTSKLRQVLANLEGQVSAYEIVNNSFCVDIIDPKHPRSTSGFMSKPLTSEVIDWIFANRVKSAVISKCLVINVVSADEQPKMLVEMNGAVDVNGLIADVLAAAGSCKYVVCLDPAHPKPATKATLYKVARIFNNFRSKQPTTTPTSEVPSYARPTKSQISSRQSRFKVVKPKIHSASVAIRRAIPVVTARNPSALGSPIRLVQPRGTMHIMSRAQDALSQQAHMKSQRLKYENQALKEQVAHLKASIVSIRNAITTTAREYHEFRELFANIARSSLDRENSAKNTYQKYQEALTTIESHTIQIQQMKEYHNNSLARAMEEAEHNKSELARLRGINERQLDVSTSELTKVKEKLETELAQVSAELVNEREKHMQQIEAIKAEHAQNVEVISQQLEQHRLNHQTELQNYRSQLEEAKQNQAEAEGAMSAASDKWERLLKEKEAQLDEEYRRSESLQQLLEEERTARNGADNDQNEALKKLEAKLADSLHAQTQLKEQYEAELLKANTDIDKLSHELVLSQDKASKLQASIDESSANDSSQASTITQLQAEVSQLQQRLATKEKAVADYSQRNSEMAVETADLRARVSALTQKLESTLDESQDHSEAIHQLQSDKEQLSAQLANIQEDRASLDEDNESLRSLLETKKQELNESMSTTKHLNATIAELKSQLESTTQEKNSMASEMATMSKPSFSTSLELPSFNPENIFADAQLEDAQNGSNERSEPASVPSQASRSRSHSPNVLKPMDNYREKMSSMMKRKKSTSPTKKSKKKATL
ncbi:hypothetical protein DIURU_003105 [Diutina rugosa]|uniref:Uncharacterized protein n=1 Tax=Diutina rugosa TaxID=5481 RepID=A0A642URX2_DIURU|nr:uncharacterized protein DIURU_003105 [Diutina rugosa]KAA8901740.1 hypothetical protein DIURU_003105 [Diutina rugosa]